MASPSLPREGVLPVSLAVEVRRVAKERRATVSQTLVSLAERGIRAGRKAKQNLRASYRRLLTERESSRKEEAGNDLIRALAEDTSL